MFLKPTIIITYRCIGAISLFAAMAAATAETISVDAGAERHPIDPRIYGVANASQDQASELRVTLNRRGGNNTSRYNWQINADNRAADYYFESIASDDGGSSPGGSADVFVGASKNAGAEPMLTIPMLDWVAKLGPDRSILSSFSVAKYGQQQGNDPFDPDAGNGILLSGEMITGNDPNDANRSSDPNFQGGWITHLLGQWGTAAGGGVRYYMTDNEPGIWHVDHVDVHPDGASMEEVRDRMIAYATKIKSLDSGAVVVGPEEWNYEGYFFSGSDEQYRAANGYDVQPDRDAHGGMAYLPWLLDQLRQADEGGKGRLLDIFSVHYYPQGGEFSDNNSASMQARRNRSTRSLWDPNYVDETYLADTIMLIPRLKGWVAQYYPGTLVAVNEYSWGNEHHINGATTQADVLGILGREGADMACRWEVPDTGSLVYNAFKMYRNYDGNGSGFGDISVRAAVTNPDKISAFASVRSGDGTMTIVVINKTTTASGLTMNLANGAWGNVAHVWMLTSSNVIQHRADVSVTDGQLKTNLPAQSISLFVVADDGGQPGNTAPNIDVPTDAQTNPAVTGQAIAFSVSASDADGDELSYQWSFGDGTQAFGASVAHVYETAGRYNATVSVSDGNGGFTFSTVNVTINAGDTLIVDTDGDSVSDASELAAGTDPFDKASTPTVDGLTLGHLKAIVRFNVVAKDTVAISGRVSDLPAGFLPAGQALTLNINGSTHTYQLDKRGLAHLKGGSGQLILRHVRDRVTHQSVFPGGDASFRLVLRGVNLADVFGLTANTVGENLGVHVEVIVNDVVYAADPTPLYTPHSGKSGVVFQ